MSELLAFRTTRKQKQQKQIETKSKETITVNTFSKRIDVEMSANNPSGFVGFFAAIIVGIWVIASLFRRREKKMMEGQTLPEATNYNCSSKHVKTFNYYTR